MQDMANPVSFPSFYCLYVVSFFIDSVCEYYFISHTITPSDFLHPSPAPHFKSSRYLWYVFASVHVLSTIKIKLQA